MVSKMGEMSGVITCLEMGSKCGLYLTDTNLFGMACKWTEMDVSQGKETAGGSRCEANCRGT